MRGWSESAAKSTAASTLQSPRACDWTAYFSSTVNWAFVCNCFCSYLLLRVRGKVFYCWAGSCGCCHDHYRQKEQKQKFRTEWCQTTKHLEIIEIWALQFLLECALKKNETNMKQHCPVWKELRNQVLRFFGYNVNSCLTFAGGSAVF